jgi:HAD superfamily hydrolase (TIGR01459 family)
LNPIAFATLDRLVRSYGTFFIDQFGVLRDDQGAYEGAADALQWLKSMGKTVVILSNSGRSGSYNAERLISLGFHRDSFDHFITSGDVGQALLSRAGSPVRPGMKCLTLSSDRDTSLCDSLGMISTGSAEDADFVVIAGSQAERISMADYASLLRPAALRGVPCYCTNPDIHKLWRGTLVPGAGSIAALYEQLGGTVTRLGKPFIDIYDHALAACGVAESDDVVCIGDSIEHDIGGAARANLASVLVETGIAADLTDNERERMMDVFGVRPTWLMARFALPKTDPAR